MTRTRFAPSPTGSLHIGSLRTAIYAYALAKHDNGQFLLRIEDTDQKREVKGAKEELVKTLNKFGLTWDEEPLIQSQRAATEVYRQAAEKLVASGHAYADQGAIRLKVPKNEKITFHDFIIRKDISWDSNQVPEAVLLKSNGFPTYHLASVVDDNESKITHIIRSVEWLPSTPIHILVYRSLGHELPNIGHPTAILDPEGGKLSKRKGNVSIEDFLEKGYLPEALLNFVILLGWAPKNNRELFTLTEFVKEFDIKGFQKSNPKLDLKKLDWFNGHYLRQKSDSELLELIKPQLAYPADEAKLLQIMPLVKDRATTVASMITLMKFFFVAPSPQDVNIEHIQAAEGVLEKVAWNRTDIDRELLEKIKQQGWRTGDFFMSLRLAICGSRVTPPLTESMLILGQEEVLSRLAHYAQTPI